MFKRKLTMVSFWYNRQEITIFTHVPVNADGRPVWTGPEWSRLMKAAGVDYTKRHATRGITLGAQ